MPAPSRIESFLARRREPAELAFRVLFSLIFLTAGMKHIVRPDQIAARLSAAPVGALVGQIAPAEALVFATGVTLSLGGLGLLLGYRTRLAAALLAATLVPITLSVQTAPGASGPLFKNIALLGGLIHFVFAGAGAWSLDARRLAARSGTRRAIDL